MQPNASDVQRQKINVNPVNYISVEKKSATCARGGGAGGGGAPFLQCAARVTCMIPDRDFNISLVVSNYIN